MWPAAAETASAASSRCTAPHPRSATLSSSAGPSPLFLGQMSRTLSIDVAWSLPAIPRLVQPAQGARAERDAVVRGQVVRQQRHRPACSLVAAVAGVTRQPRGKAARCEPALPPRSAAARPVGECAGITPGEVARQPAAHAGAIDAAEACGLGQAAPLGHPPQRLEPAIDTRVTGELERRGQTLAVRARKPPFLGSVMDSHAPNGTSSATALQDFCPPT